MDLGYIIYVLWIWIVHTLVPSRSLVEPVWFLHSVLLHVSSEIEWWEHRDQVGSTRLDYFLWPRHAEWGWCMHLSLLHRQTDRPMDRHSQCHGIVPNQAQSKYNTCLGTMPWYHRTVNCICWQKVYWSGPILLAWVMGVIKCLWTELPVSHNCPYCPGPA